jgi:hypothetical protein
MVYYSYSFWTCEQKQMHFLKLVICSENRMTDEVQ